ncbi:MAG: patatin-like phospholipase family protein [Simplicispira sp.]|nr:patatin-like phospholipase family protein [Simplicispira sp.]
MSPKPLRIGLALGSGSARGWAHIGVIRALERAGIVPDFVCGTSIGALVGAAYAAGEHERFEHWVRGLTWSSVVGLLDWKMGGGLMAGAKLTAFFRARYADPGIEHLPKAFGCVATDLASGREVWLREGSVIEAVRASIALPGLFTPALQDGRLLVDGGLVNPVPVSLCRAMGADIVIAVDLNWELVARRRQPVKDVKAAAALAKSGMMEALLARFRPAGGALVPQDMPSLLGVMSASLNIMQVRITQSRLAGEPADALIRPRLPDMAAMDFHRGAMAIDEGDRATELALPMIRGLLV